MNLNPAHPGPADDPYRARAPGAGFEPISKTPRRVFAVVASLVMVGVLAGAGLFTAAFIVGVDNRSGKMGDTEGALLGSSMVAVMVAVFLLYGQIAAGLVWLHRAWSWLPWDQRYTRHWRGWITPGQAAWFMLIPYFHYYWMFVANTALCDAFDRLRVNYPTRRPAPKNIAIAACISQFVLPVPVGSILWWLYMSRIEEMSREMSAAATARAPLRLA